MWFPAAEGYAFGAPPAIAPDGPASWHGSLIESGQDASGYQYRRNRYVDPKTGRFTQEDPIGLAGGLNLYGFASGDPVNFSDPFGLCADEENGQWRRCRVSWSSQASDRNITANRRATIQAIADLADVDLTLSSGRRSGPCTASLHNCGNAVDIVAINNVSVGRGSRANPDARELVGLVQGVASRMGDVRENFGPAGIFKSFQRGGIQVLRAGVLGSFAYLPSANRRLWRMHQNHIHIGRW